MILTNNEARLNAGRRMDRWNAYRGRLGEFAESRGPRIDAVILDSMPYFIARASERGCYTRGWKALNFRALNIVSFYRSSSFFPLLLSLSLSLSPSFLRSFPLLLPPPSSPLSSFFIIPWLLIQRVWSRDGQPAAAVDRALNEPNEQLTPRRNWVANVWFRTLNGIRRWVSNSDRRRRRRRRAERRLSPTSLSVSLLAFTSLDFMTLSHPARTLPPRRPLRSCPRCVRDTAAYTRVPSRFHNVANRRASVLRPSIYFTSILTACLVFLFFLLLLLSFFSFFFFFFCFVVLVG